MTGTEESDIQQLLSTTYPTVADTLPPFAGELRIDGDDVKVNLLRSLPLDGRNLAQVIEGRTTWRDGQSWLIPRLGGAVGPPHPLVVWWALLFALSMRARYDPEGWTGTSTRTRAPARWSLRPCSTCQLGLCPELLVETMPSV